MYCPKCGQQNGDYAVFCVRCGNPLQTTGPIRPPGPQQAYSPQSSYMNYPPSAPKKHSKGLLIGLIAGGSVLVAATIVLVILLTGGVSVVGVWYSEEFCEVLKFKDNGDIYGYTANGNFRGEFEYDKRKGDGVVTVDGEDHAFTADMDEITFEDNLGVYIRAENDFDIDSFIEDTAVAALPTETAVVPTTAPTPQPTPIQTVQTVTEQTMTLTLGFGERTGTYTGEIADGLPNGYGVFTSSTDDIVWVYEGTWVSGHLIGQGTKVWEDGYSEGGWYENDRLNGEGWESWYGVVQYEGGYLEGVHHGQGTLYNQHGEIIYSGSFYHDFISENMQDRNARVGAFKDQSVVCTTAELYSACESEISIRAQITGEIFDIYYYPESSPTYCEILIYENGVWDQDHIIQVFYTLSEGEALPTNEQTVTIWGTTEYLYSYTTMDGDYLTVPLLEAWSVE